MVVSKITFYRIQYIRINVFSVFVGTALEGGVGSFTLLDFWSRKGGKHVHKLRCNMVQNINKRFCVFNLKMVNSSMYLSKSFICLNWILADVEGKNIGYFLFKIWKSLLQCHLDSKF